MDSSKNKYEKKNRVLCVSERGIGARERHLMKDLIDLMPHSKVEKKVEKDMKNEELVELADFRNCNLTILMQMKKKKDCYLWVSQKTLTTNDSSKKFGVSCKFLLENIHTVSELKFSGNSIKSNRHILTFSKEFEQKPHLSILKNLFAEAFQVPKNHPKSRPFFDHTISFSVLDDRIWVRVYQILFDEKKNYESLNEIGPRFVLTPIIMQNGFFGGEILFKNGFYVSPNKIRSIEKKRAGVKNKVNKYSKIVSKEAKASLVQFTDPHKEIFKNTL